MRMIIFTLFNAYLLSFKFSCRKNFYKEETMARIIENPLGRRMIEVSTDDIINLVQEFQNLTYGKRKIEEIRIMLDSHCLFLPEEV